MVVLIFMSESEHVGTPPAVTVSVVLGLGEPDGVGFSNDVDGLSSGDADGLTPGNTTPAVGLCDSSAAVCCGPLASGEPEPLHE
jgi:hypothetical protein